MTLSNKAHGPPIIPRIVDLPKLVGQKSHFLFGPRQSGKSFLIRQSLPDAKVYDLLESSTYLALSREPGRIEQELSPDDHVVVIDEIQRLPELLNEAIDSSRIAVCGSC